MARKVTGGASAAVAPVAVAVGLVAGAVGVVVSALARSRRASHRTADLWSQATRGVAERDLTPPSTVAVDSSRPPQY